MERLLFCNLFVMNNLQVVFQKLRQAFAVSDINEIY